MLTMCMIAVSSIMACNQSINMLLLCLSKAAWLLVYTWDHCSSYCHGFGHNCATVKRSLLCQWQKTMLLFFMIFQVTGTLH